MTTRYRDALADREYRGVFVAHVASSWGDEMARLALAVLVYGQTASAFLAALAFAVTYLPDAVATPLLSPHADRLPRRRVLLACDLGRAVLVACMGLPGLGPGPLLVLLLAAAVLTGPFSSARQAIIADILPPHLLPVGSALSALSHQLNQAVGLLVGGGLLALLSPRTALLVDAATFVVSAAVLAVTVRARPAVAPPVVPGLRGYLHDLAVGARHVFGTPVLRALALYTWVMALCCLVPEGVGLAYARSAGAGDAAGALLVAAGPAGFTLGILLLQRVPAPTRVDRLLLLLAGAVAPLLLTSLRPPLPVVLVLFCLSGVCQASVVTGMTTFAVSVAPALRARSVGVAAGGLGVAHMVSIAGGGVLASRVDPAAAVSVAAVGGLVLLAVLWTWWPRAELRAAAARLQDSDAAPRPASPTLPVQHLGETAVVRLP